MLVAAKEAAERAQEAAKGERGRLVIGSLGAATIWSNKAADVATLHVTMGALSLVTGALITAMSWRVRRNEVTGAVGEKAGMTLRS